MPSTLKSKNTRSTSKQQEKRRLPPPPHDDQETQTSYTLSSEPVIQRMQQELILLRETSTKQNEKITSLERKLGPRDSNIVVLESQLAFANLVTDVLREKLHDQGQYSRRPSLVIEGIKSCDETEASITKSVNNIIKSDLKLPDITENNVDKFHRIGPIYNDDKQNIIKLTKHSTATKALRERRKHRGDFRSSLTRHRQNLLTYARNLCAEAEEINFICSDINCNLKIGNW